MTLRPSVEHEFYINAINFMELTHTRIFFTAIIIVIAEGVRSQLAWTRGFLGVAIH